MDSFDYVFYNYGLTLYGNMPLIEPQEFKEVHKIEEFVIVIDTSMSCSGELVKTFLEQTYHILAETESFFRKIHIRILQCDEKVQSDVKITCQEELKEYMENFQVIGNGGTDFRPAFEYIQMLIDRKEFVNLKGMIYFTDGYGYYPRKKPPYDTAFVFMEEDYSDVAVPPWAMKLIIEKEELEEIASIIRDTNIMILSDEIYAEMTYGGLKHVSIASLPDMWERTIVVNGFSKAYAMTGWRMGFLCAPAPLIKQMLKIHQYAIMCAPTTSQFAALEALKNGDDDIQMMVDEYDRRRKYIYDGLKSIGIDSFEPRGAFYIFPNIGSFGMSCEQFCEKLLYDYGCAIVPGNAFGDSGEGFARISYAYSVKHITQALERIDKFVTDIKKGKVK
jgi:hypothetical protein